MEEGEMGMLLIIGLVLILLGALPTWQHSREWGFPPGGLVCTGLLVVISPAVTGRL